MSAIAIITARGGSKRIPRKNIRSFCGKPIIAYSIEAALDSSLFDETMVSTDDGEIAEIARRYGAAVPFFRSEKTSDDYAMTNDVIMEVMQEYRNRNVEFDVISCIYPTAPFLNADVLRKAHAILMDETVDSVMPVVEFSFPPLRGMYIYEGTLEFAFPECSQKRSQDLQTMYHDCGQFYFVKSEAFWREHSITTKRCRPFLMEEIRVQDIDNESDWRIAEMKFRMLEKLDMAKPRGGA